MSKYKLITILKLVKKVRINKNKNKNKVNITMI